MKIEIKQEYPGYYIMVIVVGDIAYRLPGGWYEQLDAVKAAEEIVDSAEVRNVPIVEVDFS